MTAPREHVAAALELLDKRHLVLAIHDPSFPGRDGEDVGRGTPYSRGGLAFVEHAHALGFDGVQLGPQGMTSCDNQSPYDGTLFSKNVLSIDLCSLSEDPRWRDVVRPEDVRRLVEESPGADGSRVQYRYVFESVRALLVAAHARFAARLDEGDAAARDLADELATFHASRRDWLDRDALYDVLERAHLGESWPRWPEEDRALWAPVPGGEERARRRRRALLRQHARDVERYALWQMVVHRQHARFREAVGRLGVELFGDVQVGLSPGDAWSRQAILLSSYRLGAPPSRTNPEGQPWNYSVLDPEQYLRADGSPGPVIDFVRARLGKMLEEFDGLRIDHPHGLVCPWVYRADDPDPIHAVQHGARLFSSPDLPDHPDLERYAIARPEQLDRSVTRHADGWVRELDDAQVERYAALFDAVVAEVRAHGRDVQDILCEVLSTQPYPLRRVMERHGVGRFRVTQKANVEDPDDVYRSENARPEDWIMVGNHDTAPIWALAKEWQGSEAGAVQARYLARRLCPEGDPAAVERELSADPRKLVHAKMADLFVSRARNVMVFFPDLLGIDEVYNRPGTVNDQNWTLRVPRDWDRRYEADAAEGRAVDLACVLALAIRARGAEFARAHGDLLARLEAAAWWVPAR